MEVDDVVDDAGLCFGRTFCLGIVFGWGTTLSSWPCLDVCFNMERVTRRLTGLFILIDVVVNV